MQELMAAHILPRLMMVPLKIKAWFIHSIRSYFQYNYYDLTSSLLFDICGKQYDRASFFEAGSVSQKQGSSQAGSQKHQQGIWTYRSIFCLSKFYRKIQFFEHSHRGGRSFASHERQYGCRHSWNSQPKQTQIIKRCPLWRKIKVDYIWYFQKIEAFVQSGLA